MSVNGDLDRARKVFVVHGRNGAARSAMFAFLRAIGLAPIEWSEAVRMTGEGSPYIGQVLDTALDAAQAIVVLLTPDEVAYLRTEYAGGEDDPETQPQPQARPNVLFEAGMAMGRDAKRTVLVEMGKLRPFSDVAGRHAVRIDGSASRRKELAQRLESAGCAVSLAGEDWLTAGDFTAPPPPGGGLPAANDHVSLHFNSTPDGGDVVVISGQAEVLHGAPPPSEVPGMLDKYLGRIQAMGYTREWYDSYNTAIRVTRNAPGPSLGKELAGQGRSL